MPDPDGLTDDEALVRDQPARPVRIDAPGATGRNAGESPAPIDPDVDPDSVEVE